MCDSGETTPTLVLVLHMFILLMSNEKVQEKLCTEPKEPEQGQETSDHLWFLLLAFVDL